MPLYQLGKFFYVPGRLEKVKKTRMFISLASIIAVLAAVLFIPLPHSVIATMEVQPHGANSVYVDFPEGGWLEHNDVRPGQTVVKDQKLAVLVNEDLQMEIAKLEGKEKEYEVKLDTLQALIPYDSKAAGNMPETQDALKATRDQLDKLRSQSDNLTLKAGCDGTVLPPPPTTQPRQENLEGAPLPSWSGTPLDEKHCRPYLRGGTLFCQVGDPRSLEAVLVIDQGDIDFVHEGQSAELRFNALSGDTFEGKIERLSNSNLKITPQRLLNKYGGELPSHADPETGVETPQSASYQALVPIEDKDGLLRIGLRGQAKIHTAPLSIGARLWRFLMHTFHFKM
jgi:putative peptide zinc metalloprotease protein